MESLDKDMQWIMKYFEREFRILSESLLLQAKEYERRLEGLNHEAERIKTAQDKSISVDKFDGTVGQIYEKTEGLLRDLRKDIADLKEFKLKQEGKSQLLQYIPWLLTATSLIMLWLKR